MKATNRKQRVDGAAGAVDSMQNVLAGPPEIPPFVKLRDVDRPFWDAIMRARARDEWGLVELGLAAQLARVMADIEAEQTEVERESPVVQKGNWPTVNPRTTALTNMTVRQLKLMTALKITGAVVGDTEDMVPGRKAEREAERAVKRARVALPDGVPADEPPLLAL